MVHFNEGGGFNYNDDCRGERIQRAFLFKRKQGMKPISSAVSTPEYIIKDIYIKDKLLSSNTDYLLSGR